MATFITRFEPEPHGGGLRIAVKDLIDIAGSPTTNGSKVIAATAQPAIADAACLAGTRAAEKAGNATIVGKTNLHELAFGVTGINPWFGTPVNPIDPRLVPGGSSSGSAVAVATNEADVAFGSDTGGSIRVPAACCGIVGLKTTRGRIPMQGVLPLSPSLDTVGPMGASVAMVAEGMALLEPGFQPAEHPAVRVGRLRLPAEHHIDEALDAALDSAGLQVVEVELPQWSEATTVTMTILMGEAWQTHQALWSAHAGDLSPEVSARLEASSYLSPPEIAGCWETARSWATDLRKAFEQVDLIALPTLGAPPPEIENASRLTETRFVAPFNASGTPAISMPVRTRKSGPPASLQLAGPSHSEELLLATASVIEAAAGWRP